MYIHFLPQGQGLEVICELLSEEVERGSFGFVIAILMRYS